jgi:hypothetical protein
MTAYITTPELVAKQVQDFNFWYPHDKALSEVQLVSLDLIQSNLLDYYRSLVDQYAEVIRCGGAMPPVVLRLYPNRKRYTIRDGTHRDLASRACGLTHIPALIEQAPVRSGGQYRSPG